MRQAGSDHAGGLIRNNFFHRTSSQPGDVAISVADSPNTQVLNNVRQKKKGRVVIPALQG